MGGTEKAVFLRQQLNSHLPTHMRALIQFNSKQSWDNLLVALDQASPHVDVNLYNFSTQLMALSIKQEPLDVNAASVSHKNSFQGVRHYYKKPGHKLVNCFKREQANRNNSNSVRTFNNSSSNQRCQNNSNSRSSRNFSSNDNSCNARNSNDRDNVDRHSNFRASRDSNTRSTTSNTITVFTNDEDTVESNAIEVEKSNQIIDFTSIATSVPLMKRTVIVTLLGSNEECRVKALFDGGATNSFIR